MRALPQKDGQKDGPERLAAAARERIDETRALVLRTLQHVDECRRRSSRANYGELWLDCADRWRRMAREWAARAGESSTPSARRLRIAAQEALFAAHDAEMTARLLIERPLRSRATA